MIADAGDLREVPTPALILERRILQANLERMQQKAERMNVVLRPHMKTAKSSDVGVLATQGRRERIAVSTIAELHYFAARGFTDVLYSVSIVPEKVAQIAQFARHAGVTVILDDVGVASRLESAARDAGVTLDVMIELDCDGHRAGVQADDPVLIEIAKTLQNGTYARFRGVLLHAGESYNAPGKAELLAAAEGERDAAFVAAERIRKAGIPCPLVSIGSTPTARSTKNLSGVNELRPGVYMFNDLFQMNLGVCQMKDIAVSVLATVVSHRPELSRIIVDAGALALSKDRGTATQQTDWGYGAVCSVDGCRPYRDLVVSDVAQEHGIVTSRMGSFDLKRFPIGSKVRILPNHACLTCAAYDEYHVIDDNSSVVATWDKCGGWYPEALAV